MRWLLAASCWLEAACCELRVLLAFGRGALLATRMAPGIGLSV
jgi:hypothetical protein